MKPQFETIALMRGSKAAVNIVLWPPSEWPMQPMRSRVHLRQRLAAGRRPACCSRSPSCCRSGNALLYEVVGVFAEAGVVGGEGDVAALGEVEGVVQVSACRPGRPARPCRWRWSGAGTAPPAACPCAPAGSAARPARGRPSRRRRSASCGRTCGVFTSSRHLHVERHLLRPCRAAAP